MHFLIVIPTYNRPDLLVEAVDSVMAQDHQDWHMIVSDNQSEIPATVALGSRLADPRIRVVRQPDHVSGTEHGRKIHRLAAAETYDYANFLADDDFLIPGALSHIASQRDLDDVLAGNIAYYLQKSGEVMGTGEQFRGDVVHINARASVLFRASEAGLAPDVASSLTEDDVPETHVSFFFLHKRMMEQLSERFGSFLIDPFGDIGLGRAALFGDAYSYITRPIGVVRIFNNYGQNQTDRHKLALHHKIAFHHSPLKHVSFANCAAESYLTLLSDLGYRGAAGPPLFLRHLREILQDRPKTLDTLQASGQALAATVSGGQALATAVYAAKKLLSKPVPIVNRFTSAARYPDIRSAAEALLAHDRARRNANS